MVAKSHRQRSRITASLLLNRHVVRFVIAPHGFGKSHAVLEYAETMFSFKHVFWIRGDSPCFLRDLDAATLASGCFEVDERCSLVIFEDVPNLDSMRVERFKSQVESLLALGSEVIVTCIPSNASFAKVFEECQTLVSHDLLLSDDEYSTVALKRSPLKERTMQALRMPLLAWGEPADRERLFLEGLITEAAAANISPLVASVLVLQEGTLSDLAPFGLVRLADVERLMHDYPHLGFDLQVDSFEMIPIGVEPLALKYKHSVGSLAALTDFRTVDDVALRWADILLSRGRSRRACEVVRQFCKKTSVASWLVAHSRALVREACALSALELLEDMEPSDVLRKAQLDFEMSIRYLMLEDFERAYTSVKRYAFDVHSDDAHRAFALCLTARYANAQMAKRAIGELGTLFEQDAEYAGEQEGAPKDKRAEYAAEPWTILAMTTQLLERGEIDVLVRRWKVFAARNVDADTDALLLCAALVFERFAMGSVPADGAEVGFATDMEPLELYVRRAVSEAEGRVSYFVARAVIAMERARSRGVAISQEAISVSDLVRVRRIEASLAAQRHSYFERSNEMRIKQANTLATNPDAYLDVRYAVRGQHVELWAPMLDVKLFGPLAISVGGNYVPVSLLRRKRTRVLLAMLAVNIGHEIPRDHLLHELWPHLGLDSARKSFYTVWSELRSALVLSDGNCPYLVRHHNGCCLDGRVAQSDAQRFEDLLRELTFGAVESVDWPDVYQRIDTDFCDDFMPGETKNELIIHMREEYRHRLVDALVAASGRLTSAGMPYYATWFARCAIGRDLMSEEAYRVLMVAQEASGQRTAALATYNRCLKILRNELGIDPSPETSAVYERLLNE